MRYLDNNQLVAVVSDRSPEFQSQLLGVVKVSEKVIPRLQTYCGRLGSSWRIQGR